MNQFEQFQNVLSLEQKSEKIFTFKPDTNYFVGQTPHGGYLMAMMHKALVSVLPILQLLIQMFCTWIEPMPMK